MRATAIVLISVALFSVVCAVEDCSIFGVELKVTEEVGVLTSPGYEEGSKPNNVRCLWVFKAPADKFIEFSFTDISLSKHHNCLTEYVEISYDDSIPPYLRYCSQFVPEKVILLSNQNPRLSFATDFSKGENQKGFRLEYKLVDEEPKCESESFTCKQPFKCISSGKQCDGNGDCQDGSDEENCDHKTVQPTECGIPKIQPDLDRIVGGREAVPGSWPWIASLQGNYVYPSGHSCGVALLNNRYVVTAAHCIVGRFLKVFRIKFGTHHQYENDEGSITRNIERMWLHPDYNRMTSTDDLAIIKLSAPVDYTDRISPICLPEEGEELKSGEVLQAIGWGETQEVGLAEVLMQVQVPIVDPEKCRNMTPKKLPPRTICSGDIAGGKNPCFGDSGGPFMQNKDGRWVLQGVVSWGPMNCGLATEPTIYTQISAHVSWIKKMISED